jgi:hypothetical protein
MILRFCLYGVLRNLRFFEPFFLLFVLQDVGLDFTTAGTLLAYEKILGGALEVPLGVLTDRLGRRRTLIASFSLAALAFAVFGWAAGGPEPLLLLYVGQTLYAVAEALRSGSHKAIMLDWLTHTGRRDARARVIGLARFFSKTSSGLAALVAGVVVWQTGQFAALFWLAIPPTLGAAALLYSYPRMLEGALQRREPGAPTGLWAGLRAAATQPGVLGLIGVSVAFESQIKLAIIYLQPYLASHLEAAHLTVAGGIGAVLYGAWFATQGVVAGAASLLSARFGARGERRALNSIHRGAALALLALGLLGGASHGALGLLSLPLFAALAAAQNLRRPLFVTALDDQMHADYRATTLSAESQLRGWAYAASALVAGALADASSVPWALGWMGAVLGATLLVQRLRATAYPPQPPSGTLR